MYQGVNAVRSIQYFYEAVRVSSLVVIVDYDSSPNYNKDRPLRPQLHPP